MYHAPTQKTCVLFWLVNLSTLRGNNRFKNHCRTRYKINSRFSFYTIKPFNMIRTSQIHQNSVLRGQRIVYGPFSEVGYILKNPDNAAIASKRIQCKRTKHKEFLQKNFEIPKALKQERFIRDRHERLDVIKVRSAAQRAVDLGMKGAEYELEQKRNRLRKSLLEDESKYITEYTNKAQTSLDRRMEGILKRVEEIEKKNKVSDNVFAKKAYEQLAMENDEEFRNELRLESSKNLAQCRKVQMCEKEYSKIQEENDDRIWNGMYDERVRAERQKMDNAKVTEMRKRQEWAEFLDDQIKAEERLKHNQKCLDELDDLQMQEYADKREEEYELRDRILRDRLVRQAQILAWQIAENKRISERNKQEDINVERILIEDVQRKIQRAEAEKVDNRNQLRAELSLFKEASVQYRNAQAKEDAIALHMIEEDRKRIDRKHFLQRKNKEIEQKNFAISCTQQSKRMVMEKAVREADQKELDAKSNKLLGYRNEINEQLDQGKILYNPIIGKPRTVTLQNEHNEQFLEILRQRQRLEDQGMLEKMKNSKDQMRSKIREAMAKPLPEIEGTSLHPFYAYISAKNS